MPAFKKVATDLGIVAASPYQPISGLSGGNQQKAVLARPALRNPKVLIIDEPTQGVDAKRAVGHLPRGHGRGDRRHRRAGQLVGLR